MASKINSRLKNEKARASKPYDRPQQSIFRKVASTVRDILVPSWLLSVPSWGRQNAAESSKCTKKAEDIKTVKDAHQLSESVPTRLSKRLKYDSDNDFSSSRHLESRSANWFTTTTRKDLVAHNELQDMQIPSKEKKEANLTINGDDHSENSEGSASTSGCSSLVSSHQERQERLCSGGLNLRGNALETLRKDLNGKSIFRLKKDAAVSTDRSVTSVQNRSFNSSDLSLWSNETNLRLHTRPQPMFQSTKPSFNISSFGGPSFSGNSLHADKKASSPFYGGKTTYGGSSAYRRAQLSTMPYQLSKSNRSKITVKESSSHDSGCMSSAAKRILNTLEKMSTPLTDVKKIPNRSPVDISSFTPASQRHNTFLPFGKKASISPFTKGPPVSVFNKSSNVSVLRNHIQSRKNIKMEIPVHEHISSPRLQSQQSSTPEFNVNKGGGGKIRTRINQHLHHSSRANEEKQVVDEIDLPNIPLPIKILPVINLPVKGAPKDNTKFASLNSNTISVPASKGKCSFTFSNPIEYSAPKTVVSPQNSFSESSFQFSSPVVISEVTSTQAPQPVHKDAKSPSKEKETQLYTGSVNDFLRTLNDDKKIKSSKNVNEGKPSKTSSMSTYKADKELLEPVGSGFAKGLKPEAASWESPTCLIRNNSIREECVSLKHVASFVENETNSTKPLTSESSLPTRTPTISIATPISSGFGDKFKLTSGSWECSTCLVRNNDADRKCVACETENPNSSKAIAKGVSSSGFGDKFKPSLGSWECSSCLVRNNKADKKCVACESENPNVSKATATSALNVETKKSDTEVKSSSKSFQEFGLLQKTGTWECDTCMVMNPLDKSKCIACETPRQSKENSTDLKSSGFKFGASLPSSSPGTFKFGSFVMNSVPSASTSTFKFGVIPETTKPSSQQTPTSTFKFGGVSETTNPSNQVTSSTFKFGVTPETTKPSDTIKFGSSSLPVVPSADGFKFNPPVSVSPTLSSFKTVSSSEPLKVQSAIFGTTDEKTATAFKFNVPNAKSQSTAETEFCLNKSIAADQTKSEDHSTTLSKESKDHSTPTSVEHVAKDQEANQCELIPEQAKTISQFEFKAPVNTTSSTTSSAFKTTTTPVSGIGGFAFSSVPTDQSQKSSTFSFGSKTITPSIKTSTASVDASSMFTSTSTVDSVNGSQFSFKNLPNKPFAVVHSEKGMENSSPLQISASVTNQKDILQPSSKFASTANTSAGFMFGSATAPSVSPFKFGATTTTTSTSAGSIPSEMSKNPGMFAFGSTATATDAKSLKQGGFTFKSSTEEKPQFSSQNQLSFTAFKQDPSTTLVSSAASSTFEFGKPLQAPASSSGGFVFGTPKTEPTQTASTPFSFGSDSNKSVGIPHFAAFPQSQPVTTTSTLAFNFGANTSTTSTISGTFGTTSTSSNLFSFGAKNNMPTANNPINPSGMPSNPTPVFGCSTSQSVFGSNTSTIPGFGAGLPQKQEMQSNFSFGSNPSSAVASGPLFKFGSTSHGGPLEKKAAVGPPQNAGFNFNLAPQQNDMSGNYPQSFNINTPPNFNFAALPASPAPFQFVANTENTASPNAGPRRYRKAVRRGVRKPND